jgi:hypothetical protein
MEGSDRQMARQMGPYLLNKESYEGQPSDTKSSELDFIRLKHVHERSSTTHADS